MTATAPAAVKGLVAIPLEEIRPHPANRKRFDAQQLAELAASLRTIGQLTPAIVRPIDDAHSKYSYELLAGERRCRAAAMAGVPTLLCLVRECTDEAALDVLAIENNQREDPDALAQSDQYKAMLAFTGQTVATIAQRMGRSVSYIYDRLKLQQLTKPARDLLLAGTIQDGHAILLARLSKDDQARAIGDVEDLDRNGSRGSSGVLAYEHSLFDPEDTREGPFPVKAKSVKELQAWIDEFVRFDPVSPDLPQLFPETHAALQEAMATKQKVVAITYEHYIAEEARDEEERTIGPRSWKRADGLQKSKPCAHAVLGRVMVGIHRGDVFPVCIAKEKCPLHWPDQYKAAQKRKVKAAKETTPTSKGAAKADPAKEASAAAKQKAAEAQAERDRALTEQGKTREKTRRLEILQAAKPSPRVLLNLLALSLSQNLDHSDLEEGEEEEAWKILGVTKRPSGYGRSRDRQMVKIVEKVTDAALARFLTVITLLDLGELGGWNFDADEKPELLLWYATAAGVNVKAIDTALAVRWKAEDAAVAAAEKAKALVQSLHAKPVKKRAKAKR